MGLLNNGYVIVLVLLIAFIIIFAIWLLRFKAKNSYPKCARCWRPQHLNGLCYHHLNERRLMEDLW